MRNKSYNRVLALSIVFLLATVILSLFIGSVAFSFSDIISLVTTRADNTLKSIFYYSRIPRTLATVLCGGALASAGAVLQNVLSNKLASPGIIGVNAGAGFGVTLCCSLGLISGWWVSAFSFLGSLMAVMIISLFAVRTSASKTTVILGGVALNAVLNAFSEALSVLDSDVAMLTTEFRVGGFSGVTYGELIPGGIMIAVSLCLIMLFSNELDVVCLGDETAVSVGLNIKKYRIIFLVLSAVLAGAAVSMSGLLGFVGLIVPHFLRRFCFGESKKLLRLCAISGGGFLCLCDLLSRVIFAPFELPVGILMALIGGPLFVFVLIKLKGGHRNA